MSDPIAEAPNVSSEPRRESVGGVIGVLLGLAVLGAAAWAALKPSAELLDARAELAAAFEVAPLPFELEPDGDAAARLPGGERVVAFASDAADEAVPVLTEVVEVSVEGEDEGPDWAALMPTDSGRPPTRVVLMRIPDERAAAERRRLFEGLTFQKIEDLEPKGGRVLLAREEVPWHGLAARAVRERRYHLVNGEPTFLESVRVDLARPGQPWMLIAVWPLGHASTLEPVREILAAFAPR